MPPYQSAFRLPDWQQQLINSLMNQNVPTPSFDGSPALGAYDVIDPYAARELPAMSLGANVRDLYMQALSEQPRINAELDQYLEDEKAKAAEEEDFNKKLFAANAAHRMDLETEAFKESIKPTKGVNKLGQEIESSKSSKQIMDALNALVNAKPNATMDSQIVKDKSGVYRNVFTMPEEKIAPPKLKKPPMNLGNTTKPPEPAAPVNPNVKGAPQEDIFSLLYRLYQAGMLNLGEQQAEELRNRRNPQY